MKDNFNDANIGGANNFNVPNLGEAPAPDMAGFDMNAMSGEMGMPMPEGYTPVSADYSYDEGGNDLSKVKKIALTVAAGVAIVGVVVGAGIMLVPSTGEKPKVEVAVDVNKDKKGEQMKIEEGKKETPKKEQEKATEVKKVENAKPKAEVAKPKVAPKPQYKPGEVPGEFSAVHAGMTEEMKEIARGIEKTNGWKVGRIKGMKILAKLDKDYYEVDYGMGSVLVVKVDGVFKEKRIIRG